MTVLQVGDVNLVPQIGYLEIHFFDETVLKDIVDQHEILCSIDKVYHDEINNNVLRPNIKILNDQLCPPMLRCYIIAPRTETSNGKLNL